MTSHLSLSSRRVRGLWLVSLVLGLLALVLFSPRNGKANAFWILEGIAPWDVPPSFVTIERSEEGTFSYVVNGSPELFVGIGYNPIYRYLSQEERAANYHRDFRLLCETGVNHIIGWDTDKWYEQDKFDELTLDIANRYGIGVLMPFYLPPEGDYASQEFQNQLIEEAAIKIERFKNHPTLRMWGVGNEVLTEMPQEMHTDFLMFYSSLAGMFHEMDPDHPVIYRDAEVNFMPEISSLLLNPAEERPWLLYGMNIYSLELERILDEWPAWEIDRPLFITEFGADPSWEGGRALNYVSMWRMIRSHPDFALGGAPYAWTTEGPEPVDKIWGLMDSNSQPVDETFHQLSQDWLREPGAAAKDCNPDTDLR